MKYIIACNLNQAKLAAQQLKLSKQECIFVVSESNLVGVDAKDIIVVGPALSYKHSQYFDLINLAHSLADRDNINLIRIET